jgi:hypothetical protein
MPEDAAAVVRMMAKAPNRMSAAEAAALTVREKVALFCAAADVHHGAIMSSNTRIPSWSPSTGHSGKLSGSARIRCA